MFKPNILFAKCFIPEILNALLNSFYNPNYTSSTQFLNSSSYVVTKSIPTLIAKENELLAIR